MAKTTKRLAPLTTGLIAGYGRLSTFEQAQGNTLDQQVHRLRSAGAGVIYYDLESGSKDERANLQKLLTECRKGMISQVISTRIDRVSRKTRTVLEIAEELEALGVALVILDQYVDTSTASGKMFLSVLASLSQFELDMLKERVQHGLDYRKSKGNAMATPPYGYLRVKRDGVDRLEPDLAPRLCDLASRTEHSAWSMAHWVIDVYLATGSLRETVSASVEWFGFAPVAETALRRWLLNPALRGHLEWKDGTRFPDIHQPIAGEPVLKEVDRLLGLQSNRRGYGSKEGAISRPFTGVVKCGECGGSCTFQSVTGGTYARGKTGKNHYGYYRCARFGQGGLSACSNRNRVRLEVIDAAVGEALRARAVVLASVSADPDESPELPEEVLRLSAELLQLEALTTRSGIVEGAIRDLRSRINLLTREADQQQHSGKRGRAELVRIFSDVNFWAQLTEPADKKRIVSIFVRRILINAGKVVTVELAV